MGVIFVAERSVAVRLRAEIADYKRQMTEAAKATEAVGEKAKQSSEKATTGLGRMVQSASQHDQAWKDVGNSLLGIGAAATIGVGGAVASFSDFDAQMSRVQASTRETTTNMASLRQEAIEAGAATRYSATEAAAGIDELAKAGVRTEDILGGGLDGALALAAAGSLDVADAAETAASAMTQFGLEGRDVPHIADLLAAAAGKAQGSVGDMGAALNQAGLVAHATGLSIEETTAGLAAFASAGLVGSDAGTSFKSMLQRLTPQSAEAQRAMDELGISAYDAQGNFIGLEAFAGNLSTAMADLSPEARSAAMSVIFGSDAVRAANVLYEQGAQGIADWTTKVNDAGYAAETAAIATDNLQGDLERLGGSFDTALIQSGSAANDVLRSLVQTATSALDIFNGLPQPVQSAALTLGAVVGAAGLAGGAFLTLAPRVLETRKAISELKTDMPGTSRALSGLAKAAGIAGALYTVAGAVAMVSNAQAPATAGIEKTTTALLGMQRAADTDKVDALFSQFEQTGTLFGEAQGSVTDFSSAVDSLLGQQNQVENFLSGVFGYETEKSKSAEQIERMGEALAAMVESGNGEAASTIFDKLVESLSEAGYSTEQIMALMPAYGEALAGVANSQDLTADATESGTSAVEDQISALHDLVDMQAEAAGVVLSERDAQRQLEAAYDGVTESIQQQIDDLASQYEKQGLGTDAAKARAEAEAAVADKLDITTEAGRRNQSSLDDIGESTWDLIDAMVANNATQDEVQAQMADSRQKFLDAATALGLGADEAGALADELGLIPENVNVQVRAETQDAMSKLSGLRTIYDALQNKTITVAVNDRVAVSAAARSGQAVATAATGGPVFGPGTETSDSIPYRLSNNEHVLAAVEVKGLGGHAAVARLRAAARSGQMRSPAKGFATGGSPGWAGSVAAGPGMSLDGMRIVGTLTIDGLPAVIDARVSEGLSAEAADAAGRRRSGGWGR